MPPAKRILAEIGDTGLRRQGGQVLEEWHPHLSGSKAVRVYREMSDQDPIIGGAMMAFQTLVRQVEWSIRSDDESPQAKQDCEFVDECREDMQSTWTETVSEALSCLIYGWSILEIVYKARSDGNIGWYDLSPRSQDSLWMWVFDEPTGRPAAFVQQAPPRFIPTTIPLSKCVHFRFQSHKQSPEGRSLLRNAYRPWFFLKRIQEIEAIGVERDLAGLPKMEIPAECMSPGATTQQRAIRTHYENAIPKIRMGEYGGIVVPSETTASGANSGYRFTLVQSGGRRPMDVDAIVRRYESRILISMMSEFLTLGSDKVGSFSLSSDKTSLHAMAVKAMLDSIVEPINRKLIPDLCALNGITTKPYLTYGDLETEDLNAWAGAIAGLLSSGAIVPDDEIEGYVREKFGLPDKASIVPPTVETVAQEETA